MTANSSSENQSAGASTQDVRGSGLSVAICSAFERTEEGVRVALDLPADYPTSRLQIGEGFPLPYWPPNAPGKLTEEMCNDSFVWVWSELEHSWHRCNDFAAVTFFRLYPARYTAWMPDGALFMPNGAAQPRAERRKEQ